MTRRRKDPLRDLTEDERRHLTQLRRSSAAPAVHVARAAMQDQTDEIDNERVGRQAQGVVRDYFGSLADEK